MKKLILLITFIVGSLSSSFATIHYVNVAATGNDDGTSWLNAFTDLQIAIDAAADNDTLFIVNGTYRPSSATMLTAFSLDNSIHIYGSFNGTETNISDRILDKETAITGDFNGDDPFLLNSTINRNDNAKCVFNIAPSSHNKSYTFDGIRILGAYADMPTSTVIGRIGGGIGSYSNRSFNLNIDNCSFEENLTQGSSSGGAAIGITTKNASSSNPIVQNIYINRTVFAYNMCMTTSGIVFNYTYGSNSTANMVIQNSHFSTNFGKKEIIDNARSSATSTANLRVYNCTFDSNVIPDPANGTVIHSRGNTATPRSTVVVRNTAFIMNTINTNVDVRNDNSQDVYLYNNYYDTGNRWSGGLAANSDNVIGGVSLNDCSSLINAGSTDVRLGDDLNLITPISFTGKTINGNDRNKLGQVDISHFEFQGIFESLTINNDVFTLNLDTAYNCSTIQWVDCDNNNQPIVGETATTFTPTQSGNYGAIITYPNGVTETSDCQTFIVTNTKETLASDAIKFFPNPVHDILNIKTDEIIETVQVLDITGKQQLVNFYNNQIQTQQLPLGVYIVRIYTENGQLTKRFVKQ